MDHLVKLSPLSVRNVTLRIPIAHRGTPSLVANPFSLVANFYMPQRAKREVRTIIEDVSFELQNGDRLALIGPNGAGKTTLLRLLSGAISPTKGAIAIEGTVQALLNAGQGFQGEATGLENIYLRGLSMGMRLGEIRKKIPEIVEFSELGEAIYDPIQTYSAGMRARLGFAIITSREPNILLMDEWISAGDKFFVKKAQERLQSQLDVCRALVLASHSTPILREICSHGLVLDAGRELFFGKIDDAVQFYDDMAPRKPSSRRGVKRAAETELMVRRTFQAPRHRVWKAWTDPGELAEWWGPRGFEAKVKSLDLRPGGGFHYMLKSPRQEEQWGKLVYREIAEPERLLFVASFSDENADIARNPFNQTWPLQSLSQTTLAEEGGGGTLLTMRWSPHCATEQERETFAAARDTLREYWTEQLDELANFLAKTS